MAKTFKLKNPRKGTETIIVLAIKIIIKEFFQIKESPEGDWNKPWVHLIPFLDEDALN